MAGNLPEEPDAPEIDAAVGAADEDDEEVAAAAVAAMAAEGDAAAGANNDLNMVSTFLISYR